MPHVSALIRTSGNQKTESVATGGDKIKMPREKRKEIGRRKRKYQKEEEANVTSLSFKF